MLARNSKAVIISIFKLLLEKLVKGGRMSEKISTQKSAIEMAASIGSNTADQSKEWQQLGNIDLGSILKDIGQELGISWSEWCKILTNTGSWIIDSIDGRLFALQQKKVEQETSIELRESFGLPKVDLALPVFAQLAGIEARARAALKSEANAVTGQIERIKNEILNNFALFIASEINKLEEEEEMHSKALELSKTETDGVLVLENVASISETRLQSHLEKLKSKKNGLAETFRELMEKINQKINSKFEVTVFSANRQSLEITNLSN